MIDTGQSSTLLHAKKFSGEVGPTYWGILNFGQLNHFTSLQHLIQCNVFIPFKLCDEKTNILDMGKQRRRSSSQLNSAFVFTTCIVQFLYFLNPKFQASNHLLSLYSLVCVRPVWKSHCWFSHDAAPYSYIHMDTS